MYVFNGIVYGSNPKEPLKVIAVKALYNKQMILTFNNGEERLFDATELKGEVFKPLRDDAIFMHPILDHGVVTWLNGEIDCSPEYMYQHSYEYVPISSLKNQL